MRRQLAGLLVLLFAGTGLVVAAGFGRAGLMGRAFPTPMPPPPAVGTCVDLAPHLSVTEVDCGVPHDGEVVANWPATDSARRGATPAACGFIASMYIAPWASSWVGDWLVTPVSSGSTLVRAPAGDRAGDYGWHACVVTARGQPYSGNLQMVFDLKDLPPAFGTCTATGSPVPCTTPHNTELLATANGGLTLTGGTAESRSAKVHLTLADSCEAVAAVATGAADPTYGGQLSTTVGVDWIHESQVVNSWYATQISYHAVCLVTAADRPLVGSVFGLGDQPLPVG